MSSIFIGASFIIKKKGLMAAGQTGLRASAAAGERHATVEQTRTSARAAVVDRDRMEAHRGDLRCRALIDEGCERVRVRRTAATERYAAPPGCQGRLGLPARVWVCAGCGTWPPPCADPRCAHRSWTRAV